MHREKMLLIKEVCEHFKGFWTFEAEGNIVQIFDRLNTAKMARSTTVLLKVLMTVLRRAQFTVVLVLRAAQLQ